MYIHMYVNILIYVIYKYTCVCPNCYAEVMIFHLIWGGISHGFRCAGENNKGSHSLMCWRETTDDVRPCNGQRLDDKQ